MTSSPRSSERRNPDMLELSHQMRRPVAQDRSAGGESSAGEVRDEEETMSAGTRNSSNALDGGPRRDRYSVVLRNPPFSDFQWYQRPIGRPVPRAIPGAWRRHRQSTLLDSTAAGPSRPRRTLPASIASKTRVPPARPP